MQIIRAYIDSKIKLNQILIFVDDLKTNSVNEYARKLTDIIDLLRIYQVNEECIAVKYISKLQDSLNCKAYLNTLCRRNKKIHVIKIF